MMFISRVDNSRILKDTKFVAISLGNNFKIVDNQNASQLEIFVSNKARLNNSDSFLNFPLIYLNLNIFQNSF